MPAVVLRGEAEPLGRFRSSLDPLLCSFSAPVAVPYAL